MSILLTSPAYLLAIPASGRVAATRSSSAGVAGDRRCIAIAQPHALQPGLGPVRLPVQQRLRAVRRSSSSRSALDGLAGGGGRFASSLVGVSVVVNVVGRRSGGRSSDGERGGGRDAPARDLAAAASVPALRPPRRRLVRARPRTTLAARASASGTPAEFQTVGPVLGTAHPTGFPAYVILGWLARSSFAPLRRSGLPDEPPLGDPRARRDGVATVLSSSGSPAGRRSRFAGGVAFAATPIAWYLGTHADPHAFHAAPPGDRPPAPRGVGRPCGRARPAPATDRWLVAASVVYGVVARQPRAHAPARAPGIGLYVLATDAADLPAGRGSSRLRRGASSGPRRCSTSSCRSRALVRAPLVYGHPDTWDGFLYVVLGEQFRGVAESPLADPSATLGAIVGAVRDQLGSARDRRAGRGDRDGRAPAAYALLTGPPSSSRCSSRRLRRTPRSSATTSARRYRDQLASSSAAGWARRRRRGAGRGRRSTDRAGTRARLAIDGRRRAVASRSPSSLPALLAVPATEARSAGRRLSRRARVARARPSRPSSRTRWSCRWWSYSTTLWYATSRRRAQTGHPDRGRPDAAER